MKFSPTPHTTRPVQNIQNRSPQLTLCLEGQRPSCDLRPPLPSSWFRCSSGHRFGTFTWSNPASGPELLSPLNPVHPEALSMPPLLSTRPPFSRLGKCSVHMHSTSSLALSPFSPRHPRSLGLITWCHSISGSTFFFSCAKAGWFVPCGRVSRFDVLGVH